MDGVDEWMVFGGGREWWVWMSRGGWGALPIGFRWWMGRVVVGMLWLGGEQGDGFPVGVGGCE